MKSRNEIGKNIFDLEEESFETVDDGWNRQTLSAVEDNTVMVRQREREIQKIVQSIAELNAIFKDLATMVSEQVMSQTRNFFWGGAAVQRSHSRFPPSHPGFDFHIRLLVNVKIFHGWSVLKRTISEVHEVKEKKNLFRF